MNVKAGFAAVALAFAAGCATPQPYATTVGRLHPGARIEVRIRSGTLNAYAPEAIQRRDAFTVESFGASSAESAPRIVSINDGVVVSAPALDSLLVRVPRGVSLSVTSERGDVNVTDIDGPAYARTTLGNITMMLPAYGSANVTKRGSIAVTIGAQSWPRTLFFSTPNGDVSLSIEENARFGVTLLARDGTIFTDFNLHGVSKGTSERIVGSVNGGGPSKVVVETGRGAIRLLRLIPQY